MQIRYGLLFLCVAVIAAPFTGVSIVWFFSISDIFLVLAVGTFLKSMYERSEIRVPHDVAIALVAGVLLFVIEVLSVPNSVVEPKAAAWARTRLGNVLVFAAVVFIAQSREDIHLLLRVLTVSLLGVSLLTILHSMGLVGFGDFVNDPRNVLGYRIPFSRTLGVPMDYGNFGMYMCLGISTLVYESRQSGNRLALAALPVFMLAVFISQSRSTWTAVAAVLAVIAIYDVVQYWNRRGISVKPIIGVLVPIVIVGTIVFVRIMIQINPLTLRSRIKAYVNGLQIYSQHPLTGIGRATYYFEYGLTVIHNGFLSVLISFGPFALIMLLIVYVLAFRNGVRAVVAGKDPFFWVTIFAAFIGMTVELMLFDGSYTKILWLTMAILCVSSVLVGDGEAVRLIDVRRSDTIPS
ncbi:O-antigen ligase family protein [Halorientalis marina]|uniref:O-antigen ligase family protein n=1 Tax=Halorientalis marina TaxID=2931976 RepID=UPI001FF2C6F0|nr:O-antigen ligase family protein [Halorientalis marina]